MKNVFVGLTSFLICCPLQVQVSMKFNGQSSVEVHPPSNLEELKSMTSISLFMRVDPDKDPIEDRFILYLGDRNVRNSRWKGYFWPMEKWIQTGDINLSKSTCVFAVWSSGWRVSLLLSSTVCTSAWITLTDWNHHFKCITVSRNNSSCGLKLPYK